MPRGGKRPGAGRPKGKKNDATVAKALVVATGAGPGLVARAAAKLGSDFTAVELLRAIYRSEDAPDDIRFMAAVKAAPFETAKPTANKAAGPQSFKFSFGRHDKPA